MRQVGLLAAAGSYALQNNAERLKDDNENARRFAELFRECNGLHVDYDDLSTNLLYVQCDKNVVDPLDLLNRLKKVIFMES